MVCALQGTEWKTKINEQTLVWNYPCVGGLVFPDEISYSQAVFPCWRRDLVSEYSGLLHPHWVNLSLGWK